MIRCGLTASVAHSSMLDHTTSLADKVYWHEMRTHPDTSRITSHKWFKMGIVAPKYTKLSYEINSNGFEIATSTLP